ncbi:MAG: hypothetical protein JRJ20_04820, partial [Deltaproteobacteria bacterium]|nr:hypothetical protein [Deltaproteobacteria bacterium]
KRVSTYVQIEGHPETVREELKNVPGVFKVESEEKVSDTILRYRVESEKGTDFCGELNALAFRNQWILREIKTAEMTLEEIFFKVVAKEGKS